MHSKVIIEIISGLTNVRTIYDRLLYCSGLIVFLLFNHQTPITNPYGRCLQCV